MTVIIDGHEVFLKPAPSGERVQVTMSAAILFRLLNAAKKQGLKVDESRD